MFAFVVCEEGGVEGGGYNYSFLIIMDAFACDHRRKSNKMFSF